MKTNIKKIYFLISILIFSFFAIPYFVFAQTINIDVNSILPNVEILLMPRSGSFVEGSTFQVPIFINTKGKNINGIEIVINFDKNKLSVISSTGNTSIIGIWVEPPLFDNTRGFARYVGVIPNGINAQAGLIGVITFKAKAPGNAVVSVGSNSKILLNDGLGTEAQVNSTRSVYDILIKAPDGVQISSETHPVQGDWYNNNTPVFSWVKDANVIGFSYILDNKPNTIPDNVVDTEDTNRSFDIPNDGLWYFHIKANKLGVWGNTGHFLVRVDTTPPAEFKIQTNFLVAATVLSDRTLVSFFTTDNLSGIDHYEVGIIDKTQPPTESPVFVQAESPFQIPLNSAGKLEVIVRALDKAGNVRDEITDVSLPLSTIKFFQDYPIYILLGIIFLGVFSFILHLLFGHHLIKYVRHVIQIIKKDKMKEEEETSLQEKNETDSFE